MIPGFRYFIERGVRSITTAHNRSGNLTNFARTGYEGLAEFLAHYRVEIIASMPCYTAGQRQCTTREGVFDWKLSLVCNFSIR